MKRLSFRAPLVALAATTALLTVAACGGDDDGGGSASSGDGGGKKIAFLMPDVASTRYELFDAPLFEAKIMELCSDCEVLYQNADADPAKQQQQAESVLTQGVDVLVIDPVDSEAAKSIVNTAKQDGVPVIAYDRPIPGGDADYYVSFDNEKIGASIAQSLVDYLTSTGVSGGTLQVNGSPTDAAAGLIRDGVDSVIDGSAFKPLAEFDTPEWDPAKAQEWVSGQITQFPNIVGVVAANDGTGGGTIAAFKSAGVTVPPVTGNDAELAAAQRIVGGTQYNTISKPIKTVAEAAAEIAYQFSQGETPAGETELFDTPSQLFVPTVVTKENLKEVLIDTGAFKAAEICTPEYTAGCQALGIS